MGPVSLKTRLSLSGVEFRRGGKAVVPSRTEQWVLRLVDALAGESAGTSLHEAFERLGGSLLEGASFPWAIARLNPEQRGVLESAVGKALLAECLGLTTDQDFSRIEAAAFGMACRLEAEGKIEKALRVYRLLLSGSQRGPAQARLDALLGKANFGSRFEVLLRDFSGQATDYRMIVPMMAGTLAYRMTRTAAFGALARSQGVVSASRLAIASGFAVEVPVFSLGARSLRHWSGDPVSWKTEEVFRDLGSAALTLGTLKVAGSAGYRSHAFLAARFPQVTGLTEWLLPQGILYFGMLGAHGLEAWAGWREISPGESIALDVLASLLSLGVGSKLGLALVGNGSTCFQNEWALRADLASRHSPFFRGVMNAEGRPPEKSVGEIPPKLRPIYQLAEAGAVSQFLEQGWQTKLDGYLGPMFNPYMRKIQTPKTAAERIYADDRFEIHLRQTPHGTLIHNGSLEGGKSRRDGLYLVRDGAWSQPIEVSVLSRLFEGDFVLWRRADGERELRVFQENRFPLRWEDFPSDKLRSSIRSGRTETKVQPHPSPSPDPPKRLSPDVEEPSDVLNFPVPEFAAEEYWYEGVEPNRSMGGLALKEKSFEKTVCEIRDEDIVSVTIINPITP